MATLAPVVRVAENRDLDALRAMSTKPELHLTDIVYTAQNQGLAVLAVAEFDGEVAASGVLDLAETDLLPEVRLLFVKPEHRRKGLGSAVSEFLEQQARDRGFEATFMAVDPNNSKAIPMVLDLGYSPTGDHKFVEDPQDEQVTHPSMASEYYAVYRKSLTMR